MQSNKRVSLKPVRFLRGGRPVIMCLRRIRRIFSVVTAISIKHLSLAQNPRVVLFPVVLTVPHGHRTKSFSRHGVISARGEWITSQYPPAHKHKACKKTACLESRQRISRAGRGESAGRGWLVRGNMLLIKAYQRDHNMLHLLCSSRDSSISSFLKM